MARPFLVLGIVINSICAYFALELPMPNHCQHTLHALEIACNSILPTSLNTFQLLLLEETWQRFNGALILLVHELANNINHFVYMYLHENTHIHTHGRFSQLVARLSLQEL